MYIVFGNPLVPSLNLSGTSKNEILKRKFQVIVLYGMVTKVKEKIKWI